MTLQPGTILGPYEILELHGKGGMGEVYRARDSRLERDVAIKVLPAELSEDTTFKARFEREARTLSQLQHPHICTVHDVGTHDGSGYLVMEYLAGETLAERLRSGPLPLADLLRIGGQIAAAIDAAHQRGIVHRDLKPGNVMLTATGPKVVDFGLAKGFGKQAAVGDTQLATRTAPATAEGTIVGTLQYMAPEQLEGGETDARSDIWALGCLLYEMATGDRPFHGSSQASLIGSILKDEPEPPSRKQPPAPRRLDWVVGRCLEKDPERRWQSARDVAIELDALQTDFGGEEPGQPPMKNRRLPWAGWLATILATAAATWLLMSLIDPSLGGGDSSTGAAHEPTFRQLTARPSDDTVHSASISPDGEQLAFATREGLFLQIIETGEERLLPLPEELRVLEVDWLGATDLLFSASTGNDFGLYKTSIFGGAVRRLTDGAWRAAASTDGSRMAYLQGVPSRTVVVAGPDGEGSNVILDVGAKGSVWELAWSPEGRWLLVGIWGGSIDPLDTTLEAIDVETGDRHVVLSDPRFFQNWRGFLPFFWTGQDRLVIGRSESGSNWLHGNLWHVGIDRSTATPNGKPVRLTHLVGMNPKDLSASADGLRLHFLQERSQNDVFVARWDGKELVDLRPMTSDERSDVPQAFARGDDRLFLQSSRTGEWAIFSRALEHDRIDFVTTRASPDDHFLEVDPRDEALAFFRGPELMGVPLGGGQATPLLELGGDWPGISCNAAGDRCLVGERLPEGPTYVFYDFDFEAGLGDEVLRIDDYPPFTNWDLSPDGSRIVVGHNDDRLRIFDLRSGEETEIKPKRLSLGEFPAWSADGRGVFVDGGETARGALRRGLLYVSVADGEIHVLRDNWNEWNSHLVPSSDGKHLAFAANFFFDGNSWMIEGF